MTCTMCISNLRHLCYSTVTCLERPSHWKQQIWFLKTSGLWWQVYWYLHWKSRTCCTKLMVLQDRWSLMAVVSQDRFHCTLLWDKIFSVVSLWQACVQWTTCLHIPWNANILLTWIAWAMGVITCYSVFDNFIILFDNWSLLAFIV